MNTPLLTSYLYHLIALQPAAPAELRVSPLRPRRRPSGMEGQARVRVPKTARPSSKSIRGRVAADVIPGTSLKDDGLGELL